ncbi:MAG TPA: glycosyltransferase family 9 protein [Myxococcaceae bacterium]|nr:glycosyltransferase family 9 protein [Myxococcaceae bacterium]
MTEPPESVLVLRFSSVGDVILTAPALAALHAAWPRTQIFYAVKGELQHLVAHNPNVAQVVSLNPGESFFSFTRRLRALRYGALLDLHGKIRSKLLRALMPKTPSVVWHKRDFHETISVKLGFRTYRAPMHLADRYHAAVERLVGRPLARGELHYFLGPDDSRLAGEVLVGAGVDLDRPMIGISPGANWSTKRWPAPRFGELARQAMSAGYQVVVTGGKEEMRLGSEMAAVAPGIFDLSGQLDLKGLGGFIARCSAFVANDSGPMHMARALGVPTLAFFGSTDPGMFDFRGHAFMFAGLPCSPCSFFGRRRCPRGHFRCMLDLTAEAAWRSLVPLLTGGRRPVVSA